MRIRSEKFEPIPSQPGYFVSESGQILSRKRREEKLLKIKRAGVGYASVDLSQNGNVKSVYVHLLVMEVFGEDRPEGFECNHKDGRKWNNHYKNLEWVTHSDNMKHAHANGLISRRLHGKQILHPPSST